MQAGVKERYDTFIANMILNGMNGALAVRETPGYSNKRARQTANRLSTIGYIKEGLAKKQAVLAIKTGYSIEQAQKEYEEARALAMRIRQPAAAATAVTGKARLFGFDKDANIGEKTIIVISPKVKAEPKAIESKEIDVQRQGQAERGTKGMDST